MPTILLRLLVLIGLQASFADRLCAQPSSAVPAKPFRAGAAASNITPELGRKIVGGFFESPSTHVHDELHARCLVLDNGETKIAIVICDLLGVARELADAARAVIHSENSIPEENILIAATHTHSASSALGSNRFAYDQPLDDYQRFVVRRIADGVKRAVNQLAPAKIGWGTATLPQEVFNRRWVMKPGTIGKNPMGGTNDQVKMNPPRQSPNLVKPAGPTDPEICFIALQTLNSKPLALLANYSLHYVGGVGEGHISADYFGAFCDRIQQLLNADRQEPPFIALLSNGASGDINNINVEAPGEKREPYEKIHEVADKVAKATLQSYQAMKFHDWVPLGGQLQLLEIAIRHPDANELARARKIVAEATDASKKTLEQIYAERALRMNEYPATLPIPVQALRIGGVGIAGMPCEVFCETGLELKKRSPFKPSFTIEIANGYYGYMPTPEQHKLGGYETWLGTNRLEPDASRKMVEAILMMWQEWQGEP